MTLSQESIAIIGVGAGLLVGLGGLQVTLHNGLRADMRHMAVRIDQLDQRIDGLTERVARVESQLNIPAPTDTRIAVTDDAVADAQALVTRD